MDSLIARLTAGATGAGNLPKDLYRKDCADALAEIERLRKVEVAARMLSDSLNGGFVRCSRCGDQEDTTDLDFAAELREALSGHQQSPKHGEPMKLVIAQGSVKRSLEGGFSLCCGVSDMDNLIQALQFARAGMAATGGSYGWVRIDASHPCDPTYAETAKDGAKEIDRLRAEIDRLRDMIDNRNEFIAERNLWKELGQYLSEPHPEIGHQQSGNADGK